MIYTTELYTNVLRSRYRRSRSSLLRLQFIIFHHFVLSFFKGRIFMFYRQNLHLYITTDLKGG